MASAPRPPEQPPLMALLDAAARRLHDRFSDVMHDAGHGMSLSASRIMGSIPKEGIRPSELADRIGITRQSVGQLIDELEAAGYVERRPDPSDGRAKLVFFGRRGDESLPTAWRALEESDDLARDVLGDDGEAHLRTMLETLLRDAG